VPLRLLFSFGVVVSLASFLLGIAAILIRLFTAIPVPGWTSLFAIIAFLGGVQLIGMGLLGEYLSRIYEEVKQRPIYLVAEELGFPDPREVDDGCRAL